MNERINLLVDSGTRFKLAELAGSERKMGEYISRMIEDEYLRQKAEPGELLMQIGELGNWIDELRHRLSALATVLVPQGTVFTGEDAEIAWMYTQECLVCGKRDALVDVSDSDERLVVVCTRCDATYSEKRRK